MSEFCEEHEGQDEFTEGFCPWCRLAELEKENAALRAELDEYETYGICDCCHNLSDDLVDAGGHMQCKPCTTIAELKNNA